MLGASCGLEVSEKVSSGEHLEETERVMTSDS